MSQGTEQKIAPTVNQIHTHGVPGRVDFTVRDGNKTFHGRLEPGFVLNPMLSLPRNIPCLCGSKIKFKKCCLPKVPIAVKDATLDAANQVVSSYLNRRAAQLSQEIEQERSR